MNRRYCMDIGNGRVLEPHAPFRYVNHSCEPNCEFDWFDLTAEDFAARGFGRRGAARVPDCPARDQAR